MRRVRFSLLIGLLAGSMLLLAGCDSGGSNGGDDSKTVTELTVDTGNLSTLESAVKAAGLASTLGNEDNTYTVFAPKNSAFGPIEADSLLNKDALLEKVLEYHVVEGQEITASDISDDQTVTTLDGTKLKFSVNGSTVEVNGATVTEADVQASNGVVHLIDGVLLQNTNVVERASITPDFNILTKLVKKAGLTSTLSGPGPDGQDGLTVFAPTDQAFLNALDAQSNGGNGDGDIDNSEIPPNAGQILKYHVLDDVFYAADEPSAPSGTQIPSGRTSGVGTLEGSNVTIDRSGSSVTINPGDDNAGVAAPDVDVSNGVIHGIDTVLIP